MNIAEYIYYANVIKNLDTYLSLISIIGLVFALVFTLGYGISTDTYHKKNYLFIVPLIGLFITVFIPSERTMYMMAGAAIGEKVIESKVNYFVKIK